MDLTKPRAFHKTVYSGVRMAQRIRWYIPKEFKPVFNQEADSANRGASIERKAMLAKMTVEDYQAGLDKFKLMPTVELGILLLKGELDFIRNWWNNIMMAEDLAKANKDYKGILMVEREKQMALKRLVETGRIIDPDEYARTPMKNKQKSKKPLWDEKGVVDIEKIP